VIVTLYVPEDAVVAPVIVGLRSVDVKLGPLQLYVALETKGVFNVKASPAHIGELLVAVGAAGDVIILTTSVAAVDVHPPTVIVTLYVPASANVTFEIVGVRELETKLFGPVQL
jgi:hypothetical protein